MNRLILGSGQQTAFSRAGVNSILVADGGRLDELVAEGEQLGPLALARGNGYKVKLRSFITLSEVWLPAGVAPVGIWQVKFLGVLQATSSHFPSLSVFTQSCISLVALAAAGWLSFHDVKAADQVMSEDPKVPELLVNVVLSENL